MTGFTPKVRRTIIDRADRYCERCGGGLGYEVHHRRPRALGGTNRESTNTPSAGLLLCRPCHERTESHRTEAYEHGWLVRQTEEPANIPVFYRGFWVTLDDLGNLHDYPGTGDRMSLEEMQLVMCMTGHPDEDDHLCTEPPGHVPPHICDGCKITWIGEAL